MLRAWRASVPVRSLFPLLRPQNRVCDVDACRAVAGSGSGGRGGDPREVRRPPGAAGGGGTALSGSPAPEAEPRPDSESWWPPVPEASTRVATRRRLVPAAPPAPVPPKPAAPRGRSAPPEPAAPREREHAPRHAMAGAAAQSVAPDLLPSVDRSARRRGCRCRPRAMRIGRAPDNDLVLERPAGLPLPRRAAHEGGREPRDRRPRQPERHLRQRPPDFSPSR